MQPSLFDPPPDGPARAETPPDQAARDFATDPAEHVVLEASAGTGKTRVLVDRYVRLIREGVSPRNILAITFTRKAAAEMRERILVQLRETEAAETLAEIQIATIDAFCFGLLREFPLEADVDPGFEIADETEMARFAAEALDVTLRIARGLVTTHEPLRLLFTRIKPRTLRIALSRLLDSRHIAEPAIATFIARKVARRSADDVAQAFVARVRAACEGQPALVTDGPVRAAEFRWIAEELARLADGEAMPAGDVPQLQRRLERYFLTKDGKPRKRMPSFAKADQFASTPAKKRHEAAFVSVTPAIAAAIDDLEREVDGLLALGLQTLLSIVVREYQRLLDEHSVLDFAGMLDRAVWLLSRQEEFARSRLKLQSRYHHLLVDEFQDTSRQQWRLIDLLVAAWGEGEGVVEGPTSIFIVGDRKQSIYRFRHAEVVLLDEAARRISALRPGRRVRQAISTNFRAVSGLLAFVNTLAASMEGDPDLEERFAYRDTDRFPVAHVEQDGRRDGDAVLGVIAQTSIQAAAEAVAAEVSRLMGTAVVRDKDGPPRAARPDDVAILFRARAGHQVFEDALGRRGIQTYVYKGLGFFDAPEVQDLQALLRYFAQPESDLRAAELLRSRVIRLSDPALARLAAFGLASVLNGSHPIPAGLSAADEQLLARAVTDVARWGALADRISAGAWIDLILRESAYAAELNGRRRHQARENIKKVRGLIRRVENRGYATLGRLAEYFETLRAGDESNAVVEARGCVQLMTIHAAKGLEFPIVFIVNMQNPGRGRHQGISVIDRSVDGEPEVAFRSTEGTKLEERRETEELRRLLYVAVTRARDRLYLAAQVDRDGYLKHAQRSLAGLLPPSLRDVFPRAAAAPADLGEVFWDAPGQRFACRVCRPEAVTDTVQVEAPLEPMSIDRTPLLGAGGVRLATDVQREPQASVPPATRRRDTPEDEVRPSRTEERIAGTFTHRLLQWAGSRQPTSAEWEEAYDRLVRPDALVDVHDARALRQNVVTTAEALRNRTRLAELLSAGTCWYETPFSWRPPSEPGVVVRGTIDCLVVGPDGGMTVVEIKTGTPRPEHEMQVETYVAALRACYPDVPIRGEVVYPPPGG